MNKIKSQLIIEVSPLRLFDEKGKEVKGITGIMQYMDGWVVFTKGSMYASGERFRKTFLRNLKTK